MESSVTATPTDQRPAFPRKYRGQWKEFFIEFAIAHIQAGEARGSSHYTTTMKQAAEWADDAIKEMLYRSWIDQQARKRGTAKIRPGKRRK